jgi:putative transposase
MVSSGTWRLKMSQKTGRFYKAADKVQLIAPLLSETLSTADRVDLQKRIATESGLSYRTVGRYVERFKKDKLQGLVAVTRNRDDLKTISDDVVAQAIILRRELPSRSIEDIIFILGSENFVGLDEIKRSTLQRRLQQAGYSKRQMMQYVKTPQLTSLRRFQKEHRMMMLQGDIKYGPYLPIGPNGSPKQVFWIGWIDDATRYIVYGRFYSEMTALSVKDSFKMALMMCGKPDSALIDNGKQYIAYDFKMCASSLGVKLRYCRPYAPETKGKIERFNSLLDKYINEVSLKIFNTLERLNASYLAWQEEYYHKHSHSSLQLKTPHDTFTNDTRALKMVPQEKLEYAFLERKKRKVSSTGTVSFEGRLYEVSNPNLMGRNVSIVIDRNDLAKLKIECPGFDTCTAGLQNIGEDIDYENRVRAESKGLLKTDTSRYIDSIEREYKKNHPDAQMVFDFPPMAQADDKEPEQVSIYSRLRQVKEDAK